jgi:hypothetical protein
MFEAYQTQENLSMLQQLTVSMPKIGQPSSDQVCDQTQIDND